jgi:hypothetical protein
MSDKKISQLPASTTPLAGTEVLAIVQSGDTKKVSVADLTADRSVYGQAFASTKGLSDTVGAGSFFGLAGDPVTARQWLIQQGASNQLSQWVYNGAVFIKVTDLSQAGDLSLNTGNLVIGTSGKGIDFSGNTHAAGMTSETLTWYEEGAWTPTVFGDTTAGTYELQASTKGRYVRIGKVLYWWLDLWFADPLTGGGAGNLTVGGLPFTVSNTDGVPGPSLVYHFAISTTPDAVAGFVPVPNTDTMWLFSLTPAGGQTVESISVAVGGGYLRSFGQYLI